MEQFPGGPGPEEPNVEGQQNSKKDWDWDYKEEHRRIDRELAEEMARKHLEGLLDDPADQNPDSLEGVPRLGDSVPPRTDHPDGPR